MTNTSTIGRRLDFTAIDDRTRSTLRESKSLILAAMPGILDRFYDHVGKFAETSAFFRNREHMMHAKAMQLRHWGIILDGRFDDAYATSVTKIGEVHNTLGLEPRWYIGGYNVLVAGLIQAIADQVPRRGFGRGAHQKATDLQKAVSQAAMLDMDLAISVYLEAGKRDRSQTLERLAGSFESTVGGVVEIVASAATELQAVARSVTAATEHTAAQASSVSTASRDASANVEAVAAASEQLTSSIHEISRRVSESSQITNAAVHNSDETREKMDRLSEGVQKIGSIVDLISNVAEQTNLLALNATIEAARAGEAGRGFAVVAQEVKSLAEQTAKATAEIAAQIAAVQAAMSDSASSIVNITNVVKTMGEISTAIASAVEEQGAATHEISQNVQQAARGTGAMAVSIGEVTRSAGEAGESASHVLAAASELSQQAELLRGEVGKFLTTVRAA